MLDEPSLFLKHLLGRLLEPMYKYNPFFNVFYNPLASPPGPEIPRKPYYNYLHQVQLVLDAVPRRRVRVIVGDEVGLGKTIEALRVAKYLLATGEAKKILVLAPRTLIKQWMHHEIKDLLYSPGRIKRLTRKNVDEVKRELERVAEAGDPFILLASIDLVKKSGLDEHAWGRFQPYYEIVSSINWDLVIVDEAHQLNFAGARDTVRTSRLSPLCERARHLLLLSATPSRGSHKDMLKRISLLIPEHKEKLKKLVSDEEARRSFYENASNYLVYRRMKEHVNHLEGRKEFTDLESFMAIVKLGEHRGVYEELGEVLSSILQRLDTRAYGLVKVLVLKRALSSPYSFLKTFSKVVSNRGVGRPLSKLPSERALEKRIDEVVEEVLSGLAGSLPEDVVEKAQRLSLVFQELYEKGDPGFNALALLLYQVLMDHKDLPDVLKGDYIVFSEYYDTVCYLYSKLVEFFKSKGFTDAHAEKDRAIYEALRRVSEKEARGEFRRKYAEILNSATILLEREGRRILLIKLSSANQEIVHLIPDLVESIDDVVGSKGRVLKVLVSTDVASEGLNLEQFNIVVNYDVPWSPVRREQRIGRVYRLRQRRNCAVLDFVRDVGPDYEFYTKLVLKILNMFEQKIPPRSIGGVLELRVTDAKPGEKVLMISEKSIGLILSQYYESYYKEPRLSLDDAYRKLLEMVSEVKEMWEGLAPRYDEIEYVKSYVEDFTGCPDRSCFERAVEKTYRKLLGGAGGDLPWMILRLFEELVSSGEAGFSSDYVLIINDPGIEEGYVGVVEFVGEGVVKYATPLLALKRNGEWSLIHGLKAIEWIVDHAAEGRAMVFKAEKPLSEREIDEFRKQAELLANRFNLRIGERLERKRRNLADASGVVLQDLVRLKPRIQDPVVRVFGAQSIRDYEKYRASLPLEKRQWMEEASTRLVEKMFAEKGCRVLERYVSKPNPFDLLVECPGSGGFARYKVEVKSHLDKVLVAELTPEETREAESSPGEYIVCNVAGLGSGDESEWITICEFYEKLPRVKKKREEEYALLFFGPGQGDR
ncbi:MAG: SNF2-related protein [Thermosphaera sp.]